ncbi:MAG: phosphoenolpyruvate carboxylase [Puniceicoccaceae bacterium]
MAFDKSQEISFSVRMRENLPEIDRIRDLILNAFSEVLLQMGDAKAASLVQATGDLCVPNDVDPGVFAQVQSICFQIQNLVENAISLKVARRINTESDSLGESGFWLNYLHRLRQQGCRPADIAARVQSSFVEVVYTKHPTEAKRWIILHLHRQLSSLIMRLTEGHDVYGEVLEVLELLWRSGELFTTKPTVKQERRNLDYYLTEIFPKARKALDLSFRNAWHQVFPEAEVPKAPCLRIATWVGGDRDGHPLVTAEVTRETLHELRKLAVIELIQQVQVVRHEVRFHRQRQAVPEALEQWLRQNNLPVDSEEPWSVAFEHIERALQHSIDQQCDPCYHNPDDFRSDLSMIESAWCEIRAERLIQRFLDPIYGQLTFYGFHTANLDIRQNSQAYQKALIELMVQAGIPEAENYAQWPESRKLDFIQKELSHNRPFLLPSAELSDSTCEVLDTFRVVKDHLDRFGRGGIGSFIVSMTRSASDLLALFLFCKEVGLLKRVDGNYVNQIEVVPLFETMADLEASVSIMQTYLESPIVRNTLAYLGSALSPERTAPSSHAQTIMLGYSDSNKDCGIWASQWTVYNTQKRLIELSSQSGIPVRFFHGRGGTVGRGSGPMHRFIEALPQPGLEHGFRITEQGEVIAQKYNSTEHAIESFEQLVAGVSCAKLLATHDAIIERATPAMMQIRDASLAKYRALIEGEAFLPFYREATPIDVIELSKIGSRPARRTGMATLEDLRAIPWVFSWNQSRFYLPGWFGVGSGLLALKQENEQGFDYLRQIWRDWPFLRYLLYNAESTVASCSETLMSNYADLVTDASVRDRFMQQILDELRLSESMLTELLSRPFSQGRPRLYYTLKARDHRLHALHMQQIELLRQWRKLPPKQRTESPILTQLLQNINAVASGLKTTG